MVNNSLTRVGTTAGIALGMGVANASTRHWNCCDRCEIRNRWEGSHFCF